MHLEILVEDASGKAMLDILIPQIITDGTTYRIISYRGLGRLPSDLRSSGDPSKRILLANLPRLLGGYGKVFQNFAAAVVVVCDLDDRSEVEFLDELQKLLRECDPPPSVCFCLAIEEGEAWLLGDLDAVRAAYPKARKDVLASYVNDSICGTWERLADAIHPGGAKALSKAGWSTVGAEKAKWAREITPHMTPSNNRSASFQRFLQRITNLTGPEMPPPGA